MNLKIQTIIVIVIVMFFISNGLCDIWQQHDGPSSNPFPPWSRNWSGGSETGRGIGKAEWKASSNSFEGYAYVFAMSINNITPPVINTYRAEAWFGHGGSWLCPKTGNYSIVFKYKYEGSANFFLFFIPVPPLPNALVGMNGTITCKFGNKEKKYVFIHAPKVESFKDIITFRIDNITCYEGNIYNYSVSLKVEAMSMAWGARPAIAMATIESKGKLLVVISSEDTARGKIK